MVDSVPLLLVALIVLLAACFGKGIACWAASGWTGEDQRTAMAVGTLMNARGLMELIVVNIGLQRGIIESALFSVLVLMAIVTTLMASPGCEWVYGRHARRAGLLAAAPADDAPAFWGRPRDGLVRGLEGANHDVDVAAARLPAAEMRAAVDVEDVTGDRRGVGQVHDGIGDVVHRRRATHR